MKSLTAYRPGDAAWSVGVMGERTPITMLEDLAELDEAELLEGYRDGRAGESEPGGNRSLSYWRGWRNGAVDGGHKQCDAAALTLARRYLDAQRGGA